MQGWWYMAIAQQLGKGAHPFTENRPLYNWCYPRYGAAKIQLFSKLPSHLCRRHATDNQIVAYLRHAMPMRAVCTPHCKLCGVNRRVYFQHTAVKQGKIAWRRETSEMCRISEYVGSQPSSRRDDISLTPDKSARSGRNLGRTMDLVRQPAARAVGTEKRGGWCRGNEYNTISIICLATSSYGQ